MIAAAAVAAVVVAGALLSGGGGSGRPPAGSTATAEPSRRPPDDRRLLAELVAARAAALEDGDRRALARTATPGRRPRERRAAERAADIGVRRVEAVVRRLRVRGDRARVVVALTYGVRGVGGRYTARRDLRAVRTAAGWRVRAVAGGRQRPPWEVAAFRRVGSRHFVVLAPPRVDPASGGLIAALEQGYGRMRSLLLRGRLRDRYLVVVAADPGQARALTAGIRGLEQLAALTDTEVREAGPARAVEQVLSQRLIVVWPAFSSAAPDQAETVVTHELTHAVMAPYTSGRTPAWLTEGLALYVSADRRVAEAAARLAGAGEEGTRRWLSLQRLNPPAAIGRLDGDAQSAAYAYASAAAHFIVERFGRDALLELHDAYNDPDVGGTRRAVRRALGVGPARLERELRAWIAAEGAAP